MKTADQLQKKFENDVRNVIRRAWPKIVSQELSKLDEPKTTRSPYSKASGTWRGTYKQALYKYGSKGKAAIALGLAKTTFRDRLKKELAA
jgi:hypothetical protein